MKISKILDMVIDPRPWMYEQAVIHLLRDPALYERCKTCVAMNEGYGDYSRMEMAFKWESRIVQRVNLARAKQYAKKIQIRATGDGADVLIDGEKVGHCKTVLEYINKSTQLVQEIS